jgi:hypothetical protein
VAEQGNPYGIEAGPSARVAAATIGYLAEVHDKDAEEVESRPEEMRRRGSAPTRRVQLR